MLKSTFVLVKSVHEKTRVAQTERGRYSPLAVL